MVRSMNGIKDDDDFDEDLIYHSEEGVIGAYNEKGVDVDDYGHHYNIDDKSKKVNGQRTNSHSQIVSPDTTKEVECDGDDVDNKNDHRPSPSRLMSDLSRHDDPFAPREGKVLSWTNINMTLKENNKNGCCNFGGGSTRDDNNKNSSSKRYLLKSVWGEVPAKETTAIMGPSGAGKTSLLNILAGRIQSRGKVSIGSSSPASSTATAATGSSNSGTAMGPLDVRLNNYIVDPTNIYVRKQIAFVAQDDSLQVTSTPREAIRFSARLRLPKSMSNHNIEKLTTRMLNELGLAHCADTIVGGALIKGISGGERKRTSVGVELVVKPAMVFLDEPTSGLDSFSAVQLCQVLKKVANAGSSVLFTIHQPSSEIFDNFDHLILLNKGRVMYQGAVSDVPDYFRQRQQPVPRNYNPADWIMHVAQSIPMDQLDEYNFFPEDDRSIPDPLVADDHFSVLGVSTRRSLYLKKSSSNVDALSSGNMHTSSNSNDANNTKDERRVSLFMEIALLSKRELINLKRDTASVGARFGLSIFLSVLVGMIFLDVGETDSAIVSNLNSHFGSLIMVLLMSMFGTAQPSLLQFPEERPVFLREYSTNHYSVVSYFLSRLAMEACITALQILVVCLITYFCIGFQCEFIELFVTVYALAMASTALAVLLGCSVEDPKLAQEMLPILFVPQMLFAGFFVTPDLIPVWLRWARYLCSLTYAVRILLVYEFGGDSCGENSSDPGGAIKKCNTLLENIEADSDETWWNWLVLGLLFIFFRLSALTVLQQKATKFF